MKEITINEARSLRRITSADQIPESAAYYTSTGVKRRGQSARFYRLLDTNLNDVETVRVAYTDLLKGLVHVSDECDAQDFDYARLVYSLCKLDSANPQLGKWWKVVKI